jgi:hypothetical protein
MPDVKNNPNVSANERKAIADSITKFNSAIDLMKKEDGAKNGLFSGSLANDISNAPKLDPKNTDSASIAQLEKQYSDLLQKHDTESHKIHSDVYNFQTAKYILGNIKEAAVKAESSPNDDGKNFNGSVTSQLRGANAVIESFRRDFKRDDDMIKD